MSNFDTNPKTVKTLMLQIHSGELALPDFQRDFVWDAGATEELLESIIRKYPAGSLLFLQDNGEKFKVRNFTNSPITANKPVYLVLDGQQRLTSLYQALYGQGDHLYFVNLERLANEDDVAAAVLYHSRFKAEKLNVNSIEYQAENMLFPISSIIDEKFYIWIEDIIQKKQISPDSQRSFREKYHAVYQKYLQPIQQYPFPVITLGQGTELEAVCKMFETLNRRGVKLSVFELLMARAYPSNVSLRTLWDDAQEKHPIIKAFKIDPYYIIQSISLLKGKTVNRKDVLSLDSAEVEKNWQLVVESYADSLHFLQSEGVLNRKLVPYDTMLSPMAAIWARYKHLKNTDAGKKNTKIRTWFWASVFSGNYESHATARASSDQKEFQKWIDDESFEPSWLQKVHLSSSILKSTGPKQRGLYYGILSLLQANNPRDFYDGSTALFSEALNVDIDDHHIFPSNELKKNSDYKANEQLINCVINRTLIKASTNRSILDAKPSIYCQKIISQLGLSKAEEIFDSHLVNIDHLKDNNFQDFLDERAKSFIDMLAKKIGRVVPDFIENIDDREHIEETDGAKYENIDQTLVNKRPDELLKTHTTLVCDLFFQLDVHIRKIDSKIWSKNNKGDVGYYSPERRFCWVDPQSSGLKVYLYTGGEPLDHVTPISQSDGAGRYYGHVKIKSENDFERIKRSVEMAHQRMNKAVKEGINISWNASKKDEVA